MKRKTILILLTCLILTLLVLPVTAQAIEVDGCDIGKYALYSAGFTATAGVEGTHGHGSNEDYSMLVDGDTSTKWCTISQTSFHTVSIEFNSASPIIPKGYLLTTGGDTQNNPGRNPKNWTVKAKLLSTDAWTTIAEVTNDTTLGAENTTTYQFAIDNYEAYMYFKFEITAIRATQGAGSNNDWTMQLAEFRFYGEDAPAVLHVAAKDPTCTLQGNIEFYRRISDGKYFSDSECENEIITPVYIPETGHTWGGWTQTVAPTCTAYGTETRECSVCHEIESRNVSALGHTWGEWTTTVEPTCASYGTSTRECTVCHETQNDYYVAKLAHTWGEWTQTVAPTCTSRGTETRECSACNSIENRDTNLAAHNVVNGTCTVCGANENVVTTWEGLRTALAAGGIVKLSSEGDFDGGEDCATYLNVPSNISVTLDLNGKTINRHRTSSTGDGIVINVAGTLVVNDSVGTGTITGGYNFFDYSYNYYGGGVYVASTGLFVLNGGSITGNRCSSSYRANACGGGVYVDRYGTFIMNGGSITDNLLSNTSRPVYGGGVYVDSSGSFSMNGGSITGNSAVTGPNTYNLAYAGGVWVSSTMEGTPGLLNVSGNVNISGNTISPNGGESYSSSDFELLGNSNYINITGPLDPSSLIKIDYNYSPDSPVTFTIGLEGNGTYRNFDICGSSNESQYQAIYLNGTEAAVYTGYRVYFTEVEHGSVSMNYERFVAPGAPVILTVTPDAGYYCSDMNVDYYGYGPNDLTLSERNVYTFTMTHNQLTVTPTFTACPTVTVDNGITNGTVVASASTAAPGDTVTLTVTPASGYNISTVTVNGTPIAPVLGVYSFEMPSENVTVSATFTCVTLTVDSVENADIHIWANFDEIESGDAVVPGSTVMIDIDLDSAYYITSFTMNDAVIPLSAINDGGNIVTYSYVFEMPSENAVVHITTASKCGVYVMWQEGSQGTIYAYVGEAKIIETAYTGNALVIPGDTVTISFDINWILYIKEVSANDVPLTRVNGVYSFTMPDEDVSIVADISTRSVNIDDGIEHGTVTCLTNEPYNEGNTVTLSVTPETGYYVSSVTVNGTPLEPVEGVYSFEMPYESVTVSATFSEYRFSVFTTGSGTVTLSNYYPNDGETVYVTVTPDAGNVVKLLLLMKNFSYQPEDFVSFDYNYEGLQNGSHVWSFTMPDFDESPLVDVRVLFDAPSFDNHHRMQLDSEIGVGFKVNTNDAISEEKNAMYVTFSVSDGRTGRMNFADAAKEKSDEYWFTGYINALELADEITATLHLANGSTITNTYSAMEYFAAVKSAYPDNEELKALVDSLQDYGYYLQHSGWTDGNEHEAIANVLTLNEDDIDEASSAVSGYAFTKNLAGSGIVNAKYSLTFNSKTVIDIYVKPDDGVTILSPYSGTTIIGGETYYVFKTDKIVASRLNIVQNITVTTSEGEATFSVAPLSYVRSVLNSDLAEAKKYAVVAFNNYYVKVDAYAATLS